MTQNALHLALALILGFMGLEEFSDSRRIERAQLPDLLPHPLAVEDKPEIIFTSWTMFHMLFIKKLCCRAFLLGRQQPRFTSKTKTSTVDHKTARSRVQEPEHDGSSVKARQGSTKVEGRSGSIMSDMENKPGRSPAAVASSKVNDRPDRSETLGRSESESSDTFSDPCRDRSELDPRRHRNYIEDEIPVSSMPGTTTRDILPVQIMERTSESGSPGPYKFPSSVFARIKSTSPNQMEWSTASNESLFSIHMGDTNFNKDMYWLGQSGELGRSSEPITPDAGHSPSYEAMPRKAELNNEDLRRVDDRPVATTRLQMGSDSREKESARSPWEGLNLSTSPSSCRSDASGASVGSFAFPILTGDDRGSSKKSAQGSMKSRTHFKKTQPEPQTPRPDPPNPKPDQETKQGGWFLCLGRCRWCCCRYCS